MTLSRPGTTDADRDVWARLREFCRHGFALRYPPMSEEQARELERVFRSTMTPEMREQYTDTSSGTGRNRRVGMRLRPKLVLRPPATEEQLRATEVGLGFPVPSELRHLYAEVANGGLHLGPCETFHGAVGGAGEYAYARADGRTIEDLVSRSGWRLHPRIEEALAVHRGRTVIVDAMPDGFIWIADAGRGEVYLDRVTGRMYLGEGRGYFPDRPVEDDARRFDLWTLAADAPSLSAWFAWWIENSEGTPPRERGELAPEMVHTGDLDEPDAVWRGIARFGPASWRRADGTEVPYERDAEAEPKP